MRTHSRQRLVFVALLLLGFLPARAQITTASLPAAAIASKKDAAVVPAGPVVREIDDPCTRARWLLVPNPAHPEGPGRLVPSARPFISDETATFDDARGRGRSAAGQAQRFVIHSGDAVLVEEHTAIVDARLEATALGSAVRGAEFKARLRMGGKVVRVLASGPGRAAFVHEGGAWQ